MSQRQFIKDPPGGGGVTTIYAATGCVIFRGAFFRAEINFGVSFVVKSHEVIHFAVPF